MRHYELMLILDNEIDERTLADHVDNLIKVVPAENGTVDNVDIWGRRRFAYDIQKKSEGYYVVVDFHAEPATTKELDRQLGLNESVLRTKILRPDAK
ncbi:30S ribosomal protein S6 [Brevibacterium sp. ZH18]|uniref:30S ribosomal protein S6 n=1 Tax=Brevibacterium sp. ZH18 TaxID=2927784 RepID=UPI001F610363|nr:30S ribosomal protein S6 [Brevibacterium sp. ZH18]MCI4011827.1 30S ribosomal protein S6 [Brevibacterium sp. ZH18]